MPICPSCRTGYDATERSCPKCGADKPPPFSPADDGTGCSQLSCVCMWIARLGFLLGVIFSLLEILFVILVVPELSVFRAGVIPTIEAGGLRVWICLELLLGGAASWGLYVAMGIVIRMARRRSDG